MRICITVKVWQRPRVFENVLRSIRDQETKHEIMIHAALSREDPFFVENNDLCRRYCDRALAVPNEPLSDKANYLAKHSVGFDWSHLMILGSDDVVGPGFFDAYPDDCEAWGWSDLYLWEPPRTKVAYHLSEFETKPGRFAYWPGYNPAQRNESVGAGRLLRRDVLEKLDWKIHENGLGRNLDKSCSERMAEIGLEIPHSKLPEGVYMVDCKDEVSITPMDAFTNVRPMAVPDVLRAYL